MTTLTVDPAQYAAAASDLNTVAQKTQSAIGALTGGLGGSDGMGGSDNAGVEWATSYDEGARAVLDAASSAVGAAGNVAQRLHATGENHAQADASSTIGGGKATVPAAPAPPLASCPSIPSASGGDGGDEPPGWGLVSGMVGYLWPNGHQDRLHAADAAWQAAAASLQAAAAPTATAASKVSAQQSPEASAAAKACTDTGTNLRELSSVCTQLGSSCSDYAAHLDQAHHEIISTLKELLIETAAIEAAGAAFAIFTAGLDEIAAQAAVAARIATAVAKIRRVIEVLIDAARTVAAAVKGYAARAAELLAKLEPLATGAVKTAATTAVRATRASASAVARNAGPAATAVRKGAVQNFAGGAGMEATKEGITTLATGENQFDPTKIVAQGGIGTLTGPAAQKILSKIPKSEGLSKVPLGTFGAKSVINSQLNRAQQEAHEAISPESADAVKGTGLVDAGKDLPAAARAAHEKLQSEAVQSINGTAEPTVQTSVRSEPAEPAGDQHGSADHRPHH
ncbi:hypothetical protein [Williamsia maris]|uniref:Outer membrane channel protein CpnT-like N-terminal domain-containing protein n=1 Tax=Williamsia maris TaxID=72806 RepID=A0ABT1HAQ3_9NOCA|nr:hypothetical protein [Williamsia maris]MCP2174776.1 hypothetical protein [Williamsia maris]